MSTARLFSLTLPKCKQTVPVTAFTCGELGDVLCAHLGQQGSAIAVHVWNPDAYMFSVLPELITEVKP